MNNSFFTPNSVFKHVILLAIVLQGLGVSSQTIVIKAQEDANGMVFRPEPKTMTLNRQKRYTIEIHGLNSAKYRIEINPKFTKKQTDVPDILKNFFPKSNSSISLLNDEALAKIDIARFIGKKKYFMFTTNKSILAEQNEVSSSFDFVLQNIESTFEVLRDTKSHFDELYAKETLSEFINKAWEILDVSADHEITEQAKLYEKKVAQALTDYKNNIDVLNLIIAKRSLTELDEKFVSLYLELKIGNEFVKENQGRFIEMVKFFADGARAKEQITFPELALAGDFTLLELNTTKVSSDATTKTEKITLEFGNRMYMKWLNFSVGFFGNSLPTPGFALSTDRTRILKEKGPNFDVSIGAMASVNFVVRPAFKVGVGFGAALSPIDTKTRYLLGPKFTFGKKNEVAVSGGIVFAKLPALSTSISTNGKDYDIPLANVNTTTTSNVTAINLTTSTTTTTQTITQNSVSGTFSSVPLYDKWVKPGFFIGITYSLIKK